MTYPTNVLMIIWFCCGTCRTRAPAQLYTGRLAQRFTMHHMGDDKTCIVRGDFTQELPAAHAHQRN